jgi:hypothetical protein
MENIVNSFMKNIKWTKEFVYYLGYLWADGNIKRTGIRLDIVESDMIEIIDDILKIDFINFNLYLRKRNNIKWKPQASLYFCNSKLYDLFFSLYFNNKSVSSPTDLLKIIPIELKRYFFNGLIDGDGSFYISKSNKNYHFSISSTYEQDWSYIIELFKELDIKKYEISKRIQGKNKSSLVRIANYNDIHKIYEYIYPNGFEIGLRRKYNKCLNIINNKPKYTYNNSFIEKQELLNKIEELKDIKKVSNFFQCNNEKIQNYCIKHNIIKEGFFKIKKLTKSEYMSIDKSTIYMRKIGLKSKKEWVLFCKNGNRPKNIPSNPYVFYGDNWISYGDWLGFDIKKINI